MIALMLVTAVSVPELAAPAEPEIVVIGRRFDQTHGTLSYSVLTGKTRCTVTQTSGDALIDRGVCDVAIACSRTRKRGEAFLVCVAEGRRRFLSDYFRSKEATDAAN